MPPRSPPLRIAAWCLSGLLLAACGGGGRDGDGPPPLAAPPAPPAGTLGDGRLAELVEWARSSQQVPALGAMVIRNGVVVEKAVTGSRSADGNVAATTSDKWHLGSITKSMTSTLAAMLVEDGLITWDTRAADVWPELANDIHPNFRNATLRQFLSHTSGMKRDDGWSGAEDGGPKPVMQKRREWAARLLAQPPEFPPGQLSYSNAAYVVAGAMLETRAGATWESLMATRIYAPLGMNSSGFGAPGTPGAVDQPLGHWSTSNGFDPVPPGPNADIREALGPAGRAHVTLDDFALYLQAHLDGERGLPGILDAESFQMLHTAVAPGYALGWSVVGQLAPLGPGFFHNGSNLRWFAISWFSPEENCGVLLVANGGGERAEAALAGLDISLRNRINASP